MRSARLAAGWILAVARVVAAEDVPAIKVTSQSEDVIAAAKRDLETIKAVRGAAAETQRADGLHFTVPEMQLGSGAPLRSATLEGRPKVKSPNWLLEAMATKREKPGERNRNDERMSENAERDSAIAPGADEKTSRDSSGDQERREQKADVDAGVNPLAAYMSGWMTPQDYKLLKPTMGPADAVITGGAMERSGRNSPALGSASRGGEEEQNYEGKPNRGSGNAPRENPFLQALATPAQSAGPLAAAPAAQPPRPAPAASKSVAPAPSPPSETVKSTFGKPQDDSKYFKPLKKF